MRCALDSPRRTPYVGLCPTIVWDRWRRGRHQDTPVSRTRATSDTPENLPSPPGRLAGVRAAAAENTELPLELIPELQETLGTAGVEHGSPPATARTGAWLIPWAVAAPGGQTG
jgi:hypothetical protein